MKVTNDKGFTLVLVLLIITLIMIFSLTIISNVLNSARQNNKIEEQIQNQRLKEMGLLYFQKVIEKKVSLTALDELPSIPSIIFPINKDSAFSMTTTSINFYGTTNASCTKLADCTNVTIKYEIINDEGTIQGTKEIRLTENPNSGQTNGTGGTTGSNNNLLIDLDSISAKLTGLSSCKKYNANKGLEDCLYNTDITVNSDIIGRTTLVNGSLTLDTGNINITNSLLYITESAHFENLNQGRIQGLDLIVEKDATFKDIDNGIQDSILYIKGNANFEGKVGDTNNSTICVGGNIAGLSVDGIHVFSWNRNKEAYNAAGCPPVDSNGSNSLTDLLHSIIGRIL